MCGTDASVSEALQTNHLLCQVCHLEAVLNMAAFSNKFQESDGNDIWRDSPNISLPTSNHGQDPPHLWASDLCG